MTRYTGPPRNDAAGPSPQEPAPAAESDNSTTNTAKPSAVPRRIGAYGSAWRFGFGCGFRDALRLVAREIDDPHTWAVLDRLADEYALAGQR